MQFNKKVINTDTVNIPKIMYCSEETQAYVGSKKKSNEVQVTHLEMACSSGCRLAPFMCIGGEDAAFKLFIY